VIDRRNEDQNLTTENQRCAKGCAINEGAKGTAAQAEDTKAEPQRREVRKMGIRLETGLPESMNDPSGWADRWPCIAANLMLLGFLIFWVAYVVIEVVRAIS